MFKTVEKEQGGMMLKRVESLLIKFLLVQVVLLLTAQALLIQPRLAPYLSKVVYYEGVMKEKTMKTLETAK